jgi:ACR3 family arsenite efflux pump ArsB
VEPEARLAFSTIGISRVFDHRYLTCRLAFTTTARNSEAVIGVGGSAFPGHPLVYLAIILGPIVELPMLLLLARIMLGLKDRIEAAPAVGPDAR